MQVPTRRVDLPFRGTAAVCVPASHAARGPAVAEVSRRPCNRGTLVCNAVDHLRPKAVTSASHSSNTSALLLFTQPIKMIWLVTIIALVLGEHAYKPVAMTHLYQPPRGWHCTFHARPAPGPRRCARRGRPTRTSASTLGTTLSTAAPVARPARTTVPGWPSCAVGASVSAVRRGRSAAPDTSLARTSTTTSTTAETVTLR
jgi:hypothetical protein